MRNLQSLKYEYGNELNWLIVFSGDWHTLNNFQCAIMKAYFDVGLKDPAKLSGYPVAGIQACSQFKRMHMFLLEAWEAFFRVILQKHWESDPSATLISREVTGLAQCFLQSINPTICTTQPNIKHKTHPATKPSAVNRLQQILS